MAQRERKRRARAKKAAWGGALAAGVLGLGPGPAGASWLEPPNPHPGFPPTATQVDLSSRLVQGFGSIDNSETDWYTFVAPKGGSYSITTSTPSSSLDTVLAVYDGAGNRLVYNDDYLPPDLDSRVEVSLTGGVRYYFGVTNYGLTPGPTSGAYEYLVGAPK